MLFANFAIILYQVFLLVKEKCVLCRIIFDKVILSRIQREARLCFTLYGIRVETTGNSTIEAPSALGWVSLQLFNHKGYVK